MVKHRIFTAIEGTGSRLSAPPDAVPTVSIGPEAAWAFLVTGRLPTWVSIPPSPVAFFWDLEPSSKYPFTEARATTVAKRAKAKWPTSTHMVYGQHHMVGWWAHDMSEPDGWDHRRMTFSDFGDSGSRTFCQSIDANAPEIYPFDDKWNLDAIYRYSLRVTAFALACSHGTPVVPTCCLRMIRHEGARFATDDEWKAQQQGIADAGGGIWLNGHRHLCTAWDWLGNDQAAMTASGDTLWKRYGEPVATGDAA